MTAELMQPTYYVRHPDDTYSVADPQPVGATLAAQPADHIADASKLVEGDAVGEWSGATPFIQHVQSVAGIEGPVWADEFLRWYSPGEWLSEHRAAAVFLGQKLAAQSSPAEGDASGGEIDPWPIAKLKVDGDAVTATLYAPGLPDGEFDVWLEPATAAAAPADDMLESLIYAAIMHSGRPKTISDFERAAAGVADMLKRRAQPQPKGGATVEQWEAALSAVMPADFKDWWQNSRREWPAVAAVVIEAARADRDLAWEMLAKTAKAPAPVPNGARARISAYIARRKIARGLDIERVHCFDNETDLLLSDLEALVAVEAPAVGAQLAAFRSAQLEAGIPDEDLMPEDPARAIRYLIVNAREWS